MAMTRGELIRPAGAPAEFGELLRQHRLAAGLTQESLAEQAGLSVHGIQKLEGGTTHPYRDTAERLIQALQLSDQDETRFRTAARPLPRRPQPHSPTSATSGVTTRTNLPLAATSFVARVGEMERVKDRLRDSRLLTLSGSGGCGKTRLALEVARQLVGEFSDGVWLVDLGPLGDASLVSQAVATTLGIRDEPGRPVLDALADFLHSRHLLLILDNCEHLIDASAEVVDTLLRSCARVRLLATSRELLGVAGEATWRVASLSIVDPQKRTKSGGDLAERVLASESGRLFVDRAQLAAPSFELTAQNASAVAQVCQRLDGIPLAIELAAARLSMLSVDQIAARLDQRFRLLTGGNRTAVRRQQTLQATIDWSYRLLAEEERTLVRRLAVFAGSWSLEAAEALGADAVPQHLDVFELLSRLVAKSMVLVEEPPEHEPSVVRYRFLETIREYAEEKLVEAAEADLARTMHRDWYLRVAEQALDGMEGADQKRWWDRLELEHDNLRVALTWSAADPTDSGVLLRLAALLGRFWQDRGFVSEGIGWLEMALARSESTPSSARARALNWLGHLESFNGNVDRACPLLEDSITHARAVKDRRVLSMALRHLSGAVLTMGDQVRARRLIEEAVAVSREEGYKREIAWNLRTLAEILGTAGYWESVEPLLLESIAVGRQSGDITPVLISTGALARLYMMRGDLARARRICEEALAVARKVDLKLPVAEQLVIMLGDLALAERDWEVADGWYRQALSAGSVTARAWVARALRHYAAMCAARGDTRGAVRIFGATSSVHAPPLPIFSLADAEGAIVAGARLALGEDEFSMAWAEGQSLTLEQVTAEILSEDGKQTKR
jgi:predicted ATPase/transcriptional regulator with XRE-family HTH domain